MHSCKEHTILKTDFVFFDNINISNHEKPVFQQFANLIMHHGPGQWPG